MRIEHTVCNGDVVMNARVETWERAGVRVELPVAGLFIVRDGLVARWVDYWDLATIAPLLATLTAAGGAT
jgi:limonene-1,2-epoxide hydrolase